MNGFGIISKNKHTGLESWCYDIDGDIFAWDSQQEAENQINIWTEGIEPVNHYYIVMPL